MSTRTASMETGERRRTSDLAILVVSRAPALWGAERILLDLDRRLAERGIHLTVAGASPSALETETRRRQIPFLGLDLPAHRGIRRDDGSGRRPPVRRLGGELRSAFASARTLARVARSFDVIQSHSLSAHFEVALAGRVARTPTVLDAHDIVQPGLGQRVQRSAARLATATIANSRATAATLSPLRGGVHVVYPGVDLDRFRPGPPAPAVRRDLGGVPEAPLIGIVGRIDPRKGVDVLVRAVAALDAETGRESPRGGSSGSVDRRARLVIVGDPLVAPAGYASDLMSETRRLLGDRVCFAGTRSDVPDVLRALDVLVNASVAEPFGLTILEAQASGTPVVATRAGGAPEFVEDGATGMLVPPSDVGALAEALRRLLADEPLRNRLASAALDQARARFGLGHHAAALARVYRTIGGERGRG